MMKQIKRKIRISGSPFSYDFLQYYLQKFRAASVHGCPVNTQNSTNHGENSANPLLSSSEKSLGLDQRNIVVTKGTGHDESRLMNHLGSCATIFVAVAWVRCRPVQQNNGEPDRSVMWESKHINSPIARFSSNTQHSSFSISLL